MLELHMAWHDPLSCSYLQNTEQEDFDCGCRHRMCSDTRVRGVHSNACCKKAVQAAQVADSVSETRNSGATVSRRSSGQKISTSAASARLLWQVALRFITLTQLQQVHSLHSGLLTRGRA